MTQILKVDGIIKNVGSRPILTAINTPPLFLLDARRYGFNSGEKIDDIKAIGSLPAAFLNLRKADNAKYGAMYSKESLSSFRFDKDSSIVNDGLFMNNSSPITTVIVYRNNEYSRTGLHYLYCLGYPNNTDRISFSVAAGDYLNWVGRSTGTGYRRDINNLGEWTVEVHYYDTASSKIVHGSGLIEHVELTASVGINSVAIGGETLSPSESDFNLAYLACYSGNLKEDDLMNLFFEAKNNFNLL